jgi:lantibiotic modifying enzyme
MASGGADMVFDETRHEPLLAIPWSAQRAQATISRIVDETEARFRPVDWWPLHPRDVEGAETESALPLYHGACGVIWALGYLEATGAARTHRDFTLELDALLTGVGRWLSSERIVGGGTSYLMGETSVLMLRYGRTGDRADADRIETHIAANVDHPARELMWGAPGTMLAALFLFRRTGEARWADLFLASARNLWSQLSWSEELGCRYWVQDLYGRRSAYLGAVHGFVGAAAALIAGRDLMTGDDWDGWRTCIAQTVARTVTREGNLANWRAQLPTAPPKLMQYCHGAPGVLTSLGRFSGDELDPLLLAGGEAIWAAGPLCKGSNLCHGTAGNGYALLALFERTRDPIWLSRARSFAMHAIAQFEADRARFGDLRYSLWTGDPGLAVYLWDCVRGRVAFPTIDVFYAD